MMPTPERRSCSCRDDPAEEFFEDSWQIDNAVLDNDSMFNEDIFRESDFPETPSQLQRMAAEAGFARAVDMPQFPFHGI